MRYHVTVSFLTEDIDSCGLNITEVEESVQESFKLVLYQEYGAEINIPSVGVEVTPSDV